MKTDTLTGPNLSFWVATVNGEACLKIEEDECYYLDENGSYQFYDYSYPATFQPIAEREKISVKWDHGEDNVWIAMTASKTRDVKNWHQFVRSRGSTMAEAMMRCYVKSYLGDETKGE